MMDPATQQTVLLTSNVDLSLKKGKNKEQTDYDSLCFRDVTVKKDLLPTRVMK